ncbi:APC family permease [Dactylosporangium fulvum]|uniref:APC family permease n=1 Tax=Dactylosporangium fulvum TaxID=53359 RepID=UPI0031DDD1EE
MMTVPQGAALSIGAVLGTGVIALPALAAQTAGPASLLAWAALILLSVPLAATVAALGARHPDAGGVATYVRRAFGARAAAVVGWSFYFAVPIGTPAAALFGGAYVAAALGGGTRTVLLTAVGLMLVVTVGNLGGVRVSGRLQLGLAALLITLLLTATATSLPHADPANLHPFAPHGWWAVGSAAAVLVWGFAGWEAVTSLAADFRRPARDLPRATAIALLVVGVLYFGIAAASILVLGPAATGDAPLAELLARGVGGTVRAIAEAVVFLLTLGTMNAYHAGAAKLGAGLGRDGALTAWFARGSGAGEVPRRSLAVVAGLGGVSMLVVALTGTTTRALVLLTSGAFVLVYLMGSAAALRLLPRRSPAWWCAGVSLVASLALLVLTGWYVLSTLVVAAGALLYVRRTRAGRHPTPRGDRPARAAAVRPVAYRAAAPPGSVAQEDVSAVARLAGLTGEARFDE